MDIKVLNADYYFISSIVITDPELFQRSIDDNLTPNGNVRDNDISSNQNRFFFWSKKGNSNQTTIKNFISCYLGEAESLDFPMKRGLAYNGEIQKSPNKAISSFNEKEVLFRKKGNPLNKIVEGQREESFKVDSVVHLHIAPDQKSAIVYIKISSNNPGNLSDAVNNNYLLHKADSQSPLIYTQNDNGDWITTEGRKTLIDIITGVLPPAESYTFDNKARFTSAVYLRIDASESPSESEIKDGLTRLGLAKDSKYNITDYHQSKIVNLYENIWTYSSNESFATIMLSNKPQEADPFEKDFGTGPFAKSYLPLYLVTIMADNCYKCALRDPDSCAMDTDEFDRLRETKMLLNFEPSTFEHLIRLMKSHTDGRDFDLKHAMVLESLEARRIKNESIRILMEKDNEVRRKTEEEIVAKKLAKRDRDLNFLLGFIGIGQVIFAILQLVGASEIFGEKAAQSTFIMLASYISIAIFLALIVYLIVKWFRKKNNTEEKE